MSAVATYAQRLAVLPRALAVLELHPEGLPLGELACELGTGTDALREVFLAYYLADLVELGHFGQPVVEFLAPGTTGEDDVDPASAEWVRVVAGRPERELGVEHLTADQLGRLYAAGADLLALEPGNAVLGCALDSFAAALWPTEGPAGAEWGAGTAAMLHAAAGGRRRVRIEYVRQWHPGTVSRVIEPYRVVRTRRGWEVDAGPPDEVAAVRTFLVSGIAGVEVLEETFAPPDDLDGVLTAQRAPVEVELVVPQDRRWAVERYAESVKVIADDEESVSLRALLLPPVEARVALTLLVSGPDAFVVAPRGLEHAGLELARTLLAHHRGPAGEAPDQR